MSNLGLFPIDLEFLFVLMQQLGLMWKQFSITTSSFKSGIWVISVYLCLISAMGSELAILCVCFCICSGFTFFTAQLMSG